MVIPRFYTIDKPSDFSVGDKIGKTGLTGIAGIANYLYEIENNSKNCKSRFDTV